MNFIKKHYIYIYILIAFLCTFSGEINGFNFNVKAFYPVLGVKVMLMLVAITCLYQLSEYLRRKD